MASQTRSNAERISLAAEISAVLLARNKDVREGERRNQGKTPEESFRNANIRYNEKRVPAYAREALRKIGLKENQVYIVNKVILNPRGDPEPREYAHHICFEHVRRDIRYVAIRVDVGVRKDVLVWADFFDVGLDNPLIND